MNQQDFQQTLKNYRDGVNQVLPDYVNGRVNDSEALADELGLVLYSRDVLARALAASHPLALRHLREIERLDQKFLALKKGLLPLVPFYTSLRKRKPRSRSQWWYYLDEIVSWPQKPSPQPQPTSYWLPLIQPIAA
jgi:hypothetical protein